MSNDADVPPPSEALNQRRTAARDDALTHSASQILADIRYRRSLVDDFHALH